ncbi:hypothetical protein B0H13DRAFT_2388482 [Mycena leptocephala]|nr:hypothetical protein B0H13DRAFT_2388482 [Mycena leptocephala]
MLPRTSAPQHNDAQARQHHHHNFLKTRSHPHRRHPALATLFSSRVPKNSPASLLSNHHHHFTFPTPSLITLHDVIYTQVGVVSVVLVVLLVVGGVRVPPVVPHPFSSLARRILSISLSLRRHASSATCVLVVGGIFIVSLFRTPRLLRVVSFTLIAAPDIFLLIFPRRNIYVSTVPRPPAFTLFTRMLTRDYSQTGGGANSMMGSAKEMAGDIGETEKTAQAADAADGLYNQVAGKVNNVIGSMMGDDAKKASWNCDILLLFTTRPRSSPHRKAQEIAGQAKKEANKPV